MGPTLVAHAQRRSLRFSSRLDQLLGALWARWPGGHFDGAIKGGAHTALRPARRTWATGGGPQCAEGLADIYPTLLDLAGVPIPAQCDGKSLRPLLEDPAVRVRDYAFSYHGVGEKVPGHYALRGEEAK